VPLAFKRTLYKVSTVVAAEGHKEDTGKFEFLPRIFKIDLIYKE